MTNKKYTIELAKETAKEIKSNKSIRSLINAGEYLSWGFIASTINRRGKERYPSGQISRYEFQRRDGDIFCKGFFGAIITTAGVSTYAVATQNLKVLLIPIATNIASKGYEIVRESFLNAKENLEKRL